MTEILLALFLAYRSSAPSTESPAEREVRLRLLSDTIVETCERTPISSWPLYACTALVATVTKWESGLRRDIHDGKPGPSGEICIGQLHRSVSMIPNPDYAITSQEREATKGIANTDKCIDLTLRIIRYHVYRCERYRVDGTWDVSQIFAEYHHPTIRCTSAILPMSVKRAKDYKRIRNRLKEVVTHD